MDPVILKTNIVIGVCVSLTVVAALGVLFFNGSSHCKVVHQLTHDGVLAQSDYQASGCYVAGVRQRF